MDERAEVAALCRHIYAAYLTFQAANLEALDDDDCTLWDLFEPDLVRGGPAARAAFRAKDLGDSTQRGPLSISVDEPLVDVFGELAVARYYLDYAFAPPHPLGGRVRVTTVFAKRDGVWKRVHHHEGAVPTGRPRAARW